MKPEQSWYDRVVAKLDAARAKAEADREWYQFLCVYMSNAQGNRDGERLTRNEDGSATKSYKGLDVFTFTVRDGHSIVSPVGAKPERIEDRERALDRMAEVLAAAIADPHWSRDDGDRKAASSKPLYPT